MDNLWEAPRYAQTRQELLEKLHARISDGHPIRTSHIRERERCYAREWFREDSPIYAMWQHGIKWSQIQPYLEDRPGGGKRLTVPARELAAQFPFTLPETRA